MYSYQLRGKNGNVKSLRISSDSIVIRATSQLRLEDAVQQRESTKILQQFDAVTAFPEANVYVLRGRGAKNDLSTLRDRARKILAEEENLRFSGRLLEDPFSGIPVVYTENFFVKFSNALNARSCRKIIRQYGLSVKSKPGYARNAFFVAAPENTGLKIFEIAEALLNREDVDLCHPELIRPKTNRNFVPEQWHLAPTTVNGVDINAHINAPAAWEVTLGEGSTIAIIDDGIDIDHEEFDLPGKIIFPRDVTLGINDPRPKDIDPRFPEDHGTACAGVACAAGRHHASGVAPEARLMPIRLASNLGSQAEANAFYWAAKNGADVISCSWGPPDGIWYRPDDSYHFQREDIPDSTRLAIDYALTKGRGGKGCVIVWAAGNGNESIENDGYASYRPVIAVAASNDSDKRSVYSDYGQSVWCCFPSGDFGHPPFNHPYPKTPGIWTTDRSGEYGYSNGSDNHSGNGYADILGNYTATFGGTSSACPGVAGVVALMLSVNPALTADEVKQLLRFSTRRIDDNGQTYDSQGHSPFYGYGKVDAALAVDNAQRTKNSPEKFSGNQPLFDGLTFEIGSYSGKNTLSEAKRIVKHSLGNGWKVLRVENSKTEFDALPPKRKKFSLGDAWQAVYTLQDHRNIIYADPNFFVNLPGFRDDIETGADLQSAFRSGSSGNDHIQATSSQFDWNLRMIKAREAWQLSHADDSTKGAGILIGHPDSGFRSHPELDAQRVRTDIDWDFYDDDENAETSDGNHGLGTGSVIISGDNTNGQLPAVSGVAPLAELIPLRVTKKRWFVPAPVLFWGGMRKLRKAINYSVDHGCTVISISLGGPLKNRGLQRAIQRAIREGVVVVAAAGNEVRFVVYPARYQEVIAVAACNVERRPWSGSSRGHQVEITAPGESVWKATIGDNGQAKVVRGSGTSFAVATVAGVAALWLAHHGRDNLKQKYGPAGIVPVFREILQNHGFDPSPFLDPSEYGPGIINAEKVLQAPLPDSAPGRALHRVLHASATDNPDTVTEIADMFPEVDEVTVREALGQLLNANNQDLTAIMSSVGDELAFRLRIDKSFYHQLQSLMHAPQSILRGPSTERSNTLQRMHQDCFTHPETSQRLRNIILG